MHIYCDESGYEQSSRFGCIAHIVVDKSIYQDIDKRLRTVIARHNTSEFKFKKLNNESGFRMACDFVDISFEYIEQKMMGIHVILWDKQDSRHRIHGRCDIENLRRMHYHNLYSIKKTWITESAWEFYPDEFSAINWEEEIIKFLNEKNLPKTKALGEDLFDLYNSIKIRYSKVKEIQSNGNTIIQLADFYAGLCRTSRNESDKYKKWKSDMSLQKSLFDDRPVNDISKSLIHKMRIIDYFKNKASKLKLGVSLKTNGYLTTFKPSRKVTIWHYIPQGDYDKAPIRNKMS